MFYIWSNSEIWVAMECLDCKELVNGNYCASCGQEAAVRKINWHYILAEIQGVFMLERGFLFTVKELLLRPGENIRRFLLRDRKRLIKPIVFLILSSLVYTLINYYFPFEAKYMEPIATAPENYITQMVRWITTNYGYSNLLIGIFFTGWVWIFFNKYGYNLFELFVLVCYVLGMGMLIMGIFGMLENLLQLPFFLIGSLLATVYSCWSIGQFFEAKPSSYIKAFLAYFLGFISFIIGVTGLGIVLIVLF